MKPPLDRLYTLHRLLRGRRTPVDMGVLQAELECSRSTAYRAVALLRDRFGAPLERDEDGRVFYTDRSFELPGLWFTAAELEALVLVDRLLAELGTGLLTEALAPLRERVARLIGRLPGGGAALERIRVLGTGLRRTPPGALRDAAAALFEQHLLRFRYRARSHGRTEARRVSPQRLILHRDNWYLAAWCHDRQGLRVFALDRMDSLRVTDRPAQWLEEARLDRELGAGYGVFTGAPSAVAVLRFGPHAARWVADERWHPAQSARSLPGGGLELRLPYGDPTELIMDLLRYGPDVEVIAPPDLREEVAARLHAAAALYRDEST